MKQNITTERLARKQGQLSLLLVKGLIDLIKVDLGAREEDAHGRS